MRFKTNVIGIFFIVFFNYAGAKEGPRVICAEGANYNEKRAVKHLNEILSDLDPSTVRSVSAPTKLYDLLCVTVWFKK